MYVANSPLTKGGGGDFYLITVSLKKGELPPSIKKTFIFMAIFT
jgi:hypothetical protein